MSGLKRYVTRRFNKSQFRLLQDVRYELHLQHESLKNGIVPSRRSFIRNIQKEENLKLHWGCGKKRKDGWLNVDGWASVATDMVFDMRKPLALSDESVSMIFTEHVFEHFTFGDGENIAKDFYRVLKPGGTIRIIVPDLKIFAERYLAGDEKFMMDFHPDGINPGDGLNNIFYGHFHRAIYDYDMLHSLLKIVGFSSVRVGFSSVRKAEFRDSNITELNQDSDGESRTVLNLYVEAVK